MFMLCDAVQVIVMAAYSHSVQLLFCVAAMWLLSTSDIAIKDTTMNMMLVVSILILKICSCNPKKPNRKCFQSCGRILAELGNQNLLLSSKVLSCWFIYDRLTNSCDGQMQTLCGIHIHNQMGTSFCAETKTKWKEKRLLQGHCRPTVGLLMFWTAWDISQFKMFWHN